MQGDHVLWHGETGEVEFAADCDTDPDNWYVTECGGGVMLIVDGFGNIFDTTPNDSEDLEFVSRASEPPH